jgi:hypothetical protein
VNSFERPAAMKLAALSMLLLLLPALFASGPGVARGQDSPVEELPEDREARQAADRSKRFAGDALYAFLTPAGTYLSASNAGGANALGSGAKQIGQSEQFRLISRGGTKYAVQVYASGRHLTATGGGGVGAGVAVTTSAAEVGKFEEFTLACADSGWCALRTAGGHYLSAAADGGVRTDARTATAPALFRLLTPQRESQAAARPPTDAKAKNIGVISQITPVVVQGAVGVDRFGSWEEAVSHGDGAGRRKAGALVAYDHLVIAQAPEERPPFLNMGSAREERAARIEAETQAAVSVRGRRERVPGRDLEEDEEDDVVEALPEDRLPNTRRTEPPDNQPTSGPPDPASEWNGTFVSMGGRATLTCSTAGKSMSCTGQYNLAGGYHKNARGSGTYSNCGFSGPNQAFCNWEGRHEDDDKTATLSGTAALVLSGDRITGTNTVLTPTVTWKGGHAFYKSFEKGDTSPIYGERQK